MGALPGRPQAGEAGDNSPQARLKVAIARLLAGEALVKWMLGLRALLTDGAPEVHFERVALT